MDPIIGGALISGGASLLGGIFGKSKSEYVVPNYQKIRTKAEAAGFNPLTALAMAPGQVVESQNYMGSAIADAGLLLADGMAEKAKQNDPLEKLKRENELLKEKIINVTLHPKVPGVYAQREAIPSIAQAVGGSNGKATATANGNGQTGASGAAAGSSGGSLGVNPDGSPLAPRAGYDLDRQITSPPLRLFGIDFYKSDQMSNAQGIQNSLGEGWMSEAFGASLLGGDYAGTTFGNWLRKRARADQADQWRLAAQRHHNADWQRF